MLQLPQTEFAVAYELLQLFAYGTWQDYRGASVVLACMNSACSSVYVKLHWSVFPAEYQGKISLNSQQELKLKLLTVATMAGASSVRMLSTCHACCSPHGA